MATTKDFADFISDQFSGLEGLVLHRMFGEYGIYYHGHIVGFLADNRLLFQDVPTARRLLPNAKAEPLFPGSKEFLIPDDVDNGHFLCEVAEAICEECPIPKPRKSSRSGQQGPKAKAASDKPVASADVPNPEISDFFAFRKSRE